MNKSRMMFDVKLSWNQLRLIQTSLELMALSDMTAGELKMADETCDMIGNLMYPGQDQPSF